MATGWPITPETEFHGTDIVRKRAYCSVQNGLIQVRTPEADPADDWILILTKKDAAMPIRQNAVEEEEETEEEKKVFAW